MGGFGLTVVVDDFHCVVFVSGLVGIWVDLTVGDTGSKSIGLCCHSIVDEKMGTVRVNG